VIVAFALLAVLCFAAGCGAAKKIVVKTQTNRLVAKASPYTSIPWTRRQSVRLRYCQRPGGPGNFIAASRGVTCRAAANVSHALASRCYTHGHCEVDSFRCVEYYDGRYGGTFENYHHALCRDRARRIVWDGG
jgi:hypothetical protein